MLTQRTPSERMEFLRLQHAPGLLLNDAQYLLLAGKIRNANTENAIRKDGVSLFLHKIGTIFSRFPGKYGF